MKWRGPRDDDFADTARLELRAPVPPERWPYGPPDAHCECCALHRSGLHCDCFMSAADDACCEAPTPEALRALQLRI